VELLSEEAIVAFNLEQIRAILLVKLIQILKLKRNAQKSTVDFLLGLLNEADVSNASRGVNFHNTSSYSRL